MLLEGWQSISMYWPALLLTGLLASALFHLVKWPADRALALEYARRSEQLPVLPEPRPVTLLVAAWNEADNLPGFIAAFRALRYPLKDLVLIAGGMDGTYPLACSFSGPDILVIEQQPGEGKQRALRRGLALARGEIIFLTDADCLPDDASFERTLAPVLCGEEEVCTGTSHASFAQMRSVFVASQSVTQLYSTVHAPQYAPGLFGRNCAVTRSALERSRGLEAEAPTGTDYVLARKLVSCGIRICQEPLSRMISAAPTTLIGYFRQQRRWLANLVLLGPQFHAHDQIAQSLRSSILGFIMLILPLSTFLFGPMVLVAWGSMVGFSVFARLRYLAFARTAIRLPVTFTLALFQPPMVMIDFAAWARPLWDYAHLRGKVAW